MSLKDFHIMGKLGEGAFSSVWKVRRISDGQEYAMKKVKLASLTDKERQNSLNEVRILASIKNNYVISYKEAFFEDNSQSLCIVMENAGGGDLFKKIELQQKHNSYIREQDVWRFSIQMILGLKALHDLRILHRDIKCANIFLSTDGKTAKLGDLNVSKVAKNNLVYTQTGTPYYASPEVWRDQPYDNKSDIWSLGCLIYEMCALKPPFRANDMQGLYKKVQKGVFERIPSQYSADLQNLISMCLQVKASSRPTCGQLLNSSSVKKHGGDLLTNQEEDEEINTALLQTIKFPKNMKTLAKQLPKSNYDGECHSADLVRGRGRMGNPSLVKNISGGGSGYKVSRSISSTSSAFGDEGQRSKASTLRRLGSSLQKEEEQTPKRVHSESVEKTRVMRAVENQKARDPSNDSSAYKLLSHKSASTRKMLENNKNYVNTRGREGASVPKSNRSREESYSQQKYKSRAVERRGDDSASRTEDSIDTSILQKMNPREGSIEKVLAEKQEYLLNKYQNNEYQLNRKKTIPKIQTEKNDSYIQKADYLIKKYVVGNSPRKEMLIPREDSNQNPTTPPGSYRRIAREPSSDSKDVYNLKALNKIASTEETPRRVVSRKVELQPRTKHSPYGVRKNSLMSANSDISAKIKQKVMGQSPDKPQWWG